MSTVTLNENGARIYFVGNTYPIKDQIKNLGGHWDADAKSWWIGKAKKTEAEALLSAGAQTNQNAQTDGVTMETRVLAKGEYKGRVYFVIAFTQDRAKVLLCFADGSKKWWAHAAEVTITKTYAPMVREWRGHETTTYHTLASIKAYVDRMKAEADPQNRAKAETRQCWECGCAFTYADSKRNDGDWKDGYCGC